MDTPQDNTSQNEPTPPNELPEAYQWKDMNEVPVEYRSLQGYRLTIEQINWIADRAYKTGRLSTGEGHDPVFFPNWGGARQEVLDTHEPVQGFLVPREGN